MANAKDVGSQILWCGFFASSMIGMLLMYGLLQERIMQRPYSGGDVFSATQSVFFLMLLIRGAGALFALLMIGATGGNFRPEAELWKYFYVALGQAVSGACSYGALKYISYTVQAMGKSFKMMPVMLWSLAISGKVYGLADWVVATLVTGGITEFVLTGPTASSSASGSPILGAPLLVGAIMGDGFVVTMQEKLFAECKTSKFNQMLYTTGMSALVVLAALVLSGELAPVCGSPSPTPGFPGTPCC
uniref:EamA domain-containing protein n=1 Tax=Zooxanthella nutricula TaxID=1333877 RepID=A0A7S2P1A7_9DINO|mmetsp:Transcript_45061/g.136614  ORF Transcript_45061/g.136614 Transcript_45061/m.136614 type:complete len:246 (+) Transcript_45061:71-808(+)